MDDRRHPHRDEETYRVAAADAQYYRLWETARRQHRAQAEAEERNRALHGEDGDGRL